MSPKQVGPATVVVAACLLVLLLVARPAETTPTASLAGNAGPEETPTTSPASAIYLPWIAQSFAGFGTATATATPTETATPMPTATATATPTPTLPPACPLPSIVDQGVTIAVSPNSATALDKLVGRAPFTISLAATASGGAPPYYFCWDIEPDGHQDASIANPTFALTHAGIFDPLIVVIDAAGHGSYIGTPPAGASQPRGGRP